MNKSFNSHKLVGPNEYNNFGKSKLDARLLSREQDQLNNINEQILLNQYYENILISAYIIIILHVVTWAITLVVRKIKMKQDEKQSKLDVFSQQQKQSPYSFLYNFIYTIPVLLYIFTVSDMSLLVFFQFQNFTYQKGSLNEFGLFIGVVVFFYIIFMTIFIGYNFNKFAIWSNLQQVEQMNTNENKVDEGVGQTTNGLINNSFS